MTEETRKQLLEKKDKIVAMVIEKAKTQFPEDIDLIGLTGSFRTNDFHEKSDVDLIIVNNTPRGWQISYCFILDGVGHDIYCTPWSPRLEDQSKLESPMVSILLEMEVLYCAKPEYLEQLRAYQKNARELLALPIGKECLNRARKDIDAAKREYANALLSEEIGAVRYAAGGVAYHAINALTSMNNTYIKRGIKRYLEEVLAYPHRPETFEQEYLAVIQAKDCEALRAACKDLLVHLVELFDTMWAQFVARPTPTYENLEGTYEELWSNCRNKVIASTQSGDISYAFQAALGAQNYLYEMAAMFGTPKFDLMAQFDAENLAAFREAFLRAMDDYLKEYEKVGRPVERFEAFDALYAAFMKR